MTQRGAGIGLFVVRVALSFGAGRRSQSATAGSNPAKEPHMVIVAGHIIVDPQQRESYLASCVGVVELTRR